ncbi:MAG: hypothetical protein EBS06_05950 [Proteobacteria bacterium]|nr:hypothetical protein [Pseudomonadota bacterium]
MNKNNSAKNLAEIYQQQKTDFLDNLQPDDFRNGSSFNQAEIIIDEINKALYQAFLRKENPEEFIKKAVGNLFRENSQVAAKAINLANIYLEIKTKENLF